MSIPLDRLYNYIETVANKVHGNVIISRFWPHGSKNLENLCYLRQVDWTTEMTTPVIICHDQEPLNHEFYENTLEPSHPFFKLLIKYNCFNPQNLKRFNIFDQDLLLHSELNSAEVDKYSQGRFIPVYYWSHALIALDWFRFAQHVSQQKHIQKTFLIYNRAWSGTREYRAKFAELLLDHELQSQCMSRFNCVDPDTKLHYSQYRFHNPIWRPGRSLDGAFSPNTYNSTSSADFEISDYESTQIEIVLETLFDDSRIHLTEKMLRPIACGQPFIVCATPGTLGYLRSYGFRTFDSIWNEDYDTIQDPFARLQAIVKLMKHISLWDDQTKKEKFTQADLIAEYNRQHFFSKEFFLQINSELENNLAQGLQQLCATNTSQIYLNRRKELCQHKEIRQILTGRNQGIDQERVICSTAEVIKVLQHTRKYVDNKRAH